MFDVNAQLDAANSARDQQRWGDAARLYRRYLLFKRNEADIWVQLGNMLKEERRFRKSMAAYEKAISLGLNNSDLYLQIGHLHKVMGKLQDSIEYYLRSLKCETFNIHAFEELSRMGLENEANKILSEKFTVSQRSENLVVFDISDLVLYIGEHENVSGIQRVQCCVIQALLKHQLYDPCDLRFISYDQELRAFRSVCTDSLLDLLDDLALPKDRRRIEFDAASARRGRLFPQEPLIAFLRPGRTIVALLGAAWVIPQYASWMVNLKRTHDVRFAMLFHDFIPIYARETCDQGTAEVFKEFVDLILPITDLAMCVSMSTERDLKRYCNEIGCSVPPTLVTQLGTSFDESSLRANEELPACALQDAPYVLFVSTIEGRKNHKYMFDIWRLLIERGIEVPRLVCIGRLGWRAEAFLTNLLETDYLDGLIELREDVSDEALNDLYRGCLFTVFPSLYEGWGLPVGESLGHGKLCVLSDNSSLPEVAGEFGCYLPQGDIEKAADTIAALLGNPERILALENAIATGFTPLRWEEIAQRVIDGCTRLGSEGSATKRLPTVLLGKEYTLKRLRGAFDAPVGRAMLEAVKERFNAPITGEVAKSAQRANGLLARDQNWHEAEPWGCWALADQAGVQFALIDSELAGEEELVFYGAFAFMASKIGASLRLLVGGMAIDGERVIEADQAVLAWSLPVAQLRRRATWRVDGNLDLDCQFELTNVTHLARDASRAIDPRGLTFGLKSFVLLPASAIAQRLKIAERSSFKVVC